MNTALLTAAIAIAASNAHAGPITAEQVAARLERNRAVNLTPATAEQQLATSLRNLLLNNSTRFNLTPGSVSLLSNEPSNTVPLSGAFPTLRSQYLTVSSVEHGIVELGEGTRLLALSVDTDQQRIVANALPPEGGQMKVYLTARHAALAVDPATGHSLLNQISSRLRDLQDVQA